MALGAVDDGAVQAEFPGEPDGGDDIVCPVGVEVGGQAAAATGRRASSWGSNSGSSKASPAAARAHFAS